VVIIEVLGRVLLIGARVRGIGLVVIPVLLVEATILILRAWHRLRTVTVERVVLGLLEKGVRLGGNIWLYSWLEMGRVPNTILRRNEVLIWLKAGLV